MTKGSTNQDAMKNPKQLYTKCQAFKIHKAKNARKNRYPQLQLRILIPSPSISERTSK